MQRANKTINTKVGLDLPMTQPMKRYNISQPNFGILLLLNGSYREFRFHCLDQS